jgi:hypothetical protein
MNLKSSVLTVAILTSIVPSAFAQSTAPITREQVRQHLILLEQQGYRPGSAGNTNYPDDLQAAEERVAATETTIADTQTGSNEQKGVELLASKTTQSISTAAQSGK